MAVEKRIAAISIILVAGLAAAFLFPRQQSAVSDGSAPAGIQFRDDAPRDAANRSTVLTPVDAPIHGVPIQGAPTASTSGALVSHRPDDRDAVRAPSNRPPSAFEPAITHELPQLTDEPVATGVMIPPPIGRNSPNGIERDRLPPLAPLPGATAAERMPLVPIQGRVTDGRPMVAGAAVGRQVVEKPLRVHVVRDGDTLESLALRYLGDANRYREIYDLNGEQLDSPEILPLGQEIRLPPREQAGSGELHPSVTPPPLTTGSPELLNRPEPASNPLRAPEPPLVPIAR